MTIFHNALNHGFSSDPHRLVDFHPKPLPNVRPAVKQRVPSLPTDTWPSLLHKLDVAVEYGTAKEIKAVELDIQFKHQKERIGV